MATNPFWQILDYMEQLNQRYSGKLTSVKVTLKQRGHFRGLHSFFGNCRQSVAPVYVFVEKIFERLGVRSADLVVAMETAC